MLAAGFAHVFTDVRMQGDIQYDRTAAGGGGGRVESVQVRFPFNSEGDSSPTVCSNGHHQAQKDQVYRKPSRFSAGPVSAIAESIM